MHRQCRLGGVREAVGVYHGRDRDELVDVLDVLGFGQPHYRLHCDRKADEEEEEAVGEACQDLVPHESVRVRGVRLPRAHVCGVEAHGEGQAVKQHVERIR
jgi:hypothetical protein